MATPKLYKINISEATTKIRRYGTSELLALDARAGTELNTGLGRGAAVYYQVLRHKAASDATKLEAPAATEKTAGQIEAEREKRRQGLRMLRGLNARREGGPVDGLQFQDEQRETW